MSDETDFHELVERCRMGDQDSSRQLFDIYVDRLVGLARRRISQRLAGRVDPEDVVQSVFRTFFVRLKAGQFRFEDQDDLCKLLMRITVHKALRQVARQQAARRDAERELGQGDEAQRHLVDLISREPTPDDVVAFLDHLEHFLSCLRPEERKILEMRLQGHGTEEIAASLGTYDRKVRRCLERIRGLAEQDGWVTA